MRRLIRRQRRGRSGEAGAVAVVVAVVVTLLLIPTAALAVDLGTAYVRTSELQAAADTAAEAGGAEIARRQRAGADYQTVVSAAVGEAVRTLCADNRLVAGWSAACGGDTTWATDGDPANGEVVLYSGTPREGHVFGADQAATGNAPVSGIRVVTPGFTVRYGLAAAFGATSATLHKASTAALLTVLPVHGVLPMFVVQNEYGSWCARSAPRTVWNLTAPSGVSCVPTGYLDVPRTDPLQNLHAAVWNTALGIDTDHLPAPGSTVRLKPQVSPASALVRDLAPGLVGGTGSSGTTPRLAAAGCPGGLGVTSGGQSGLENAHLADFVDTRVGSVSDFRTAVTASTPPASVPSGWLDGAILRCSRLAVIPEINVTTPPSTGLPDVDYTVTALRLVWIDNEFRTGDPQLSASTCLQRGLYWADPNFSWICRTDLRAIVGYVLDPRLLPALVPDEDAVNTTGYLSASLPATVRLVRDADDPPPG